MGRRVNQMRKIGRRGEIRSFRFRHQKKRNPDYLGSLNIIPRQSLLLKAKSTYLLRVIGLYLFDNLSMNLERMMWRFGTRFRGPIVAKLTNPEQKKKDITLLNN